MRTTAACPARRDDGDSRESDESCCSPIQRLERIRASESRQQQRVTRRLWEARPDEASIFGRFGADVWGDHGGGARRRSSLIGRSAFVSPPVA